MKILLLMTLLSVSTFSQTVPNCDIAVEKLGALRGLNLRMTESDLRKLPVVEKPLPSTVGARDFETPERVQIRGLKNTPSFSARTYEGKVSSFTVYYANDVISSNPDEFMKRLATELNLPTNPWFLPGIVKCPEFQVVVNAEYNFVMMFDRIAGARITQAASDQKQKQQKTSKQ